MRLYIMLLSECHETRHVTRNRMNFIPPFLGVGSHSAVDPSSIATAYRYYIKLAIANVELVAATPKLQVNDFVAKPQVCIA